MKKIRKPRLAGKRLLQFTLFGNRWDVREVPRSHKLLDGDDRVFAMVYYEEYRIYIAALDGDMTVEQQQTSLLHEIQHIIEEHYCINHLKPAEDENGSEDRTDRISLGWLYVIRGCPEVLSFVTVR